MSKKYRSSSTDQLQRDKSQTAHQIRCKQRKKLLLEFEYKDKKRKLRNLK